MLSAVRCDGGVAQVETARLYSVPSVPRLWPNDFIPGEAAQLLPLPRHFGQLAQLITEDMVTARPGSAAR